MLRALLVAALLVAGCSGSGDDEPGPAPAAPQRWTVELGTAPTLLAVVDDAVLAASYGNGVGGSQVYRVDRATGRLVAQRTVAGQPNGLAVGPDGALWLATLRLPDQVSGTGLQVLDPVSLATRRTLPVEGVPLSVAFVGEALWIGDERGVHQVDPADGAVLRTVPTAHPATRLRRWPAGRSSSWGRRGCSGSTPTPARRRSRSPCPPPAAPSRPATPTTCGSSTPTTGPAPCCSRTTRCRWPPGRPGRARDARERWRSSPATCCGSATRPAAGCCAPTRPPAGRGRSGRSSSPGRSPPTPAPSWCAQAGGMTGLPADCAASASPPS